MIKIAIIADIHHGKNRGSKNGEAAAGLFEKFRDWAHNEKCDLVVDLGDRISDVGTDTDIRLQQEVSSWFSQFRIPVRYINGNHDVDFLDNTQLTAAMGTSVETTSLELGGYNLIFWCGSARLKYQVGIVPPNERELDDLKKMLDASPLPAIIFSHIPLNHPEFTGHFVHEKIAPEAGRYEKEVSEGVRNIIERSNKAVLCINGHTHWNTYQAIDGIHYFSVPSLTEMFTTYPEPNAGWSLLTLNGPHIRLKVFGKTPIEYAFPIKEPLGRHWLNVHKDYSPAKIQPE